MPASAAPDALLGTRRELGQHDGSRTGWRSGLGGTSRIWGGQLLPWEDWEFQGVGGPAWPIESSEISPHYDRVRTKLGLSSTHAAIHERDWRTAEFAGGDLSIRRSTWMSPNERDFTKNSALKRHLGKVRVETDFLVTRIERTPVGLVVVGDRRGEEVRSEAFVDVVLTAGVLGNVRLLDRYFRGDKANLVGAGFMDHVSARVARLRVSDWSRFREHAAQRKIQGVRTSVKYVTTPEFVRREGVHPGYGHWEFDVSQSALAETLRTRVLTRRSLSELPREGLSALRALKSATAGAHRPLPDFATPYLRVDVEQLPSRERSLRWHADSGGEAMQIRWEISDDDVRSIRLIGDRVLSALTDDDIGASPDCRIETLSPIDTKHMMGGALMGLTAAESVVDTWGAVHGSSGLWVGGASVFPSGGVANPTFTALALADRMADAIKS